METSLIDVLRHLVTWFSDLFIGCGSSDLRSKLDAMRITLATSGSEVALDVPRDVLEGGTVKQLKQLLAQHLGHSRFCLRLIDQDGTCLPNTKSVTDLDLQLVLVAFAPVEGDAVLKFVQACGAGDLEVVEHMLEMPHDPDLSQGMPGLHLAAQSGRREVIELLLEAGAHINKTCVALFSGGSTALHFAAENEQLEVIRLLLDHGAEILADKEGMTPLHCACKHGKLETLQVFLDAKLDLERATKDVVEMTSLHLAAEAGHLQVVTRLLEAKAEKDRQNPEGASAFSLNRFQRLKDPLNILLKGF